MMLLITHVTGLYHHGLPYAYTLQKMQTKIELC
jgi:hypothetical protein